MMLRKRSRKDQSKDQSMLNSASESNFSPTTSIQRNKTSSFFSLPGLFVGFASKRSSDNDPSRSPTSPLDSKVFSNLGNSFVRSPRWDSDRVGLGIVDSLNDETKAGEVFGLSKSGRNIVFGSQMKINVPNSVTHCQSPLEDSLVTTPRSLPETFKAPPQNHHIGSPKPQSGLIPVELNPLGKIRSCSNCNDFGSENNKPQVGSPLLIKKGNDFNKFSSSLPVSFNVSFHGRMGSFIASEIELSEDYTRIISHGPNPKTTHIYGDLILEDDCLESNKLEEEQIEGSVVSVGCLDDGMPFLPDDFLSFCYACKKKLEVGKDVYMYRGEKAFCSCTCRDQEMLVEEETKPASCSPQSSDDEFFQTDEHDLTSKEASANSYLDLLNGLGIISSGVLGALYAMTKKEEASNEVQSEKRLVDDLRGQINVLHLQITQSNEEKNEIKAKLKEKIAIIEVLQERVGLLGLEVKDQEKTIKDLKSSLDEKESQCKDLDSIVEITKVDLIETSSKAKGLKDEVFKTQELVELKKSKIDGLNVKIKLVLEEIDRANKRIHALHEDYDRLKLSFERKADTDSRHLSKKDSEIHQLDEKLKLALGEASKNHVLVVEFAEVQETLQRNLDEANSQIEALSEELVLIKEAMKASEVELSGKSDELKEATIACKSLKKEILKVHKRAETATNDLKEERKMAATLKKQLASSTKQLTRDSESRRSLERDLEETSKSLNNMSKSLLLLTKELDTVNVLTSSLESEKEMLYKSLEEQKNVTKEAKENIEDTQRLIEKLGVERGKWERKSKKLEKNLLSAESEILELKMQINAGGNASVNSHPLEEVNASNETSVNSKHSKKTKEVTSTNSNSVVPKKITRRRKKGSA
ncbi:MAR-binding filament-like protein 1 [Acorus calamus]|uniref:MAR-binding filament-like protein 1 n=1 Tax=Acorus calamus TaxID=4465 RepID=A0AAV9DZI1_ACOCL|nr:MAR-binding filament-like protein 1 [Acorus calamus]